MKRSFFLLCAVLSVAIGVGQGLQPVAAFNYGARRFARVRKAAIFTNHGIVTVWKSLNKTVCMTCLCRC